MPVVYIHGVATRSTKADDTVTGLMRRYLTDAIAPGGDLEIVYAYWGDVAASFAWGGASRPRTPLRGMGGEAELDPGARAALAAYLAGTLDGLPEPEAAELAPIGLVAAGPRTTTAAAPGLRLRDLGADQLSDLLVAVVLAGGEPSAELLIAVDEIAHDPETARRLAEAPDLDAEWRVVSELVEARTGEGLAGMGGGGFFARLGDRLKESMGRGVGVPGYVASRLVAEFRAPINTMASMFVGDVMAYVNNRGDAAAVGSIPSRLLEALRTAREAAPADEPLVVISHSMGGQVVYDTVTHFLPKAAAWQDLRIDYWCATASQVGLFEELKLFLESDPSYQKGSKVPFPDRAHLGGWWNVWDHNDFISYTGADIFEGVDDEAFNTGMTLVGAHSGYLVRPSFYRMLAGKLEDAAAGGWGR